MVPRHLDVKSSLIFAVLLMLSTPHCRPQNLQKSDSKPLEAWNAANNPQNILSANSSLERRYDKLPKAAEVNQSKRPWTDSYWPYSNGGIAWRWMSKTPVDFKTYKLLSKDQVQKMSLKQRLELSPAEKFDIVSGYWNFPTVLDQRQKIKPDAPQWFGHCTGWSSASIHFREPRPVVIKSVDGIEVPFGASDVKALLSFYMHHYVPFKSYIGQQCDKKLESAGASSATLTNLKNSPECQDVNAGSFHLLLTNMIGRLNKPVVGDLSNGEEVWNYPIIEYKSYELEHQNPTPGKAAPGTVREIKIHTDVKLKFPIEPQLQNFNETGQKDVADQIVSYQYTLELNKNEEIIGGEWITEKHPDLFWYKDPPENFLPFFKKIPEIYEASLKSNPSLDLLNLK